jgi:hypothetical protein
LVALGLLLGANAVARANVAVFVDVNGDTLNNDGEALLDYVSNQELDLYLEIARGTSSSGTACRETSTGDDICGYRIEIEIEGAGQITDFVPDVESNPASWPLPPTQKLTIAATTTAAAKTKLYIGELEVDATAGDSRVLVKGHRVVDAGLKPNLLPEDTVAFTLPEPHAMLQLLCSAMALALLRRLRRR